jgi:hypothetical protein
LTNRPALVAGFYTGHHTMRFLSQCEPINGCGKTYPSDLSDCPHCGTSHAFSVPASVDIRDWGYDIETYPNCFTATFIHIATGLELVFEISTRKNDVVRFAEFVYGLGRGGARGVGFNNLGFDYPVIHWILANTWASCADIYQRAMTILKAKDAAKHALMIWDSEHVFEQLDLFKIRHFDNKAKFTSLKALEIVMRSRNVKDLPFPVGTMLTEPQMDVLLAYNRHDVIETCKFYVRTLPEIHLRESLSEKYSVNMLNFSNTKIGMTILVSQMEKSGIQCYTRDGQQKRVPRQTPRQSIAFADVIFPYVKFEHPEFNRILELFKSKTITRAQLEDITDSSLVTKGVFKDLTCTIDGFKYVFGVGGIHGSVESQIVRSDDEFVIEDADVTSFYPMMGIVNGMYPEHLGDQYCDTYFDIFNQRNLHAKGTPENAALKESLNASYGNSNNKYGPLFDPKYTMMTTINGQLMLCMLAEQLIKVPGLTIVQCNTDGVTYRMPRRYADHVRQVCKWWEGVTRLSLEYAHYDLMAIRDVNNYSALTNKGKVKRKGAYEYETLWHQDPSAQVVARAAEAALIRGESYESFIRNHRDPFDFMCRAKVPRASQLVMRWPDFNVELELQNTTRYFVSRTGGNMIKISPPTGTQGSWKRKPKLTDDFYNAVVREITGQPGELDSVGTPWDARIHTGNKSTHETRYEKICAGYRVTDCADAGSFDWGDLNYQWYIDEAAKLVLPLTNSTIPLEGAR